VEGIDTGTMQRRPINICSDQIKVCSHVGYSGWFSLMFAMDLMVWIA